MAKRKRATVFMIHCGQHVGDNCPDKLCAVINPLEKFNCGKLPRTEQVSVS